MGPSHEPLRETHKHTWTHTMREAFLNVSPCEYSDTVMKGVTDQEEFLRSTYRPFPESGGQSLETHPNILISIKA